MAVVGGGVNVGVFVVPRSLIPHSSSLFDSFSDNSDRGYVDVCRQEVERRHGKMKAMPGNGSSTTWAYRVLDDCGYSTSREQGGAGRYIRASLELPRAG